MNKHVRKLLSICMVLTMTICLFSNVRIVSASMPEYEIYPKPHEINYKNNTFILRDKVNVVFEDGIDKYTKKRLEEVAKLKGQTVSTSEAVIDTEKVTNIIVGIYNSQQYVDNYVKENHSMTTKNLFDKMDSYYLTVDNGTIVILGKDTDAAFYGLTTLYQIYAQLESKTIRNFTIEDYADVASRGFIEGYYGNPWSVEDRQELMKWGGYYKLNSYFYAPKDDPKHNAQWRALYTQEELETKIKPLAQAGNESKCRFVFALHPYMNNAIRYNTEENYQADLAIMQAKFSQVIEAGVRQIAILADDANNVGAANYTRTLEDMSEWLKEKQKTYPDLKLTLPFCTQEYMGSGQGYYADFPENVQIVMTGGRVWGEVSNNFTTTFTNNVGRGPYLWINWPCTDNSKKHLIMGGYDTFLHPGVNPEKIQGIVLNPMQQSEPSKVAIFGNACYSWNIWESKAEADETWDNSFKYVDHNSAVETEASKALRELSKHMINQNMDSRVTVLQESVDLKVKLNDLKDKLSTGSVSKEQIDDLITEFTLLQDSEKIYRDKAGDKRVKNQITYWLDCWKDTTTAAISYLNALKAVIGGDNTTLLSQYSNGQKAFAQSKTYGFHYVDHTEYAEVGVQHIVPFIKALDNYLSNQVKSIANPNTITKTYISNSFTNPYEGSAENVFDENDGTSMVFHNPNYIYKDDYIGVMFNRGITVDSIRFLMGGGKNHFFKSKLQYTVDGTSWQDVSSTIYTRPNGSTEAIEEKNLSLTEVKGIRLLCTENNGLDAWLNIASIDINKEEKKETSYPIQGIEISSNIKVADTTHTLPKVIDGDKSTEAYLKEINTDTIPENATVTVDLGTRKQIGSVYMAQGSSAVGDIINSGVVEYSNDKIDWKLYGNLAGEREQTVTGKPVSARYIRIRNTVTKKVWWRLAEIQVNAPKANNDPISYTVIKTDRWAEQAGNTSVLMYDGDDNTFAWFDPDGKGNTTEDTVKIGDYIGYDLGKVAKLESLHIINGADNEDKILKLSIETSLTGDDDEWTVLEGYEEYTCKASGKDILDIPLAGLEARYIRMKNLQDNKKWVKISEFTVKEIPSGETKHLYTNVDTKILSNVSTEGDIASLTSGTVDLNQNQYIGLKLDTIKDLKDITVDTNSESKNLKIQISKNSLIWSDVNTGSQNADARYVRIINTGSSKLSLTINEFKVTSHEIKPISLHSSNIPITGGWGDTRDNGMAFDGQMSTTNKFGGNPTKGQYIIYDLGQSINMTSLRTYVADSEKDFIRDAKFQVSNDLKEWTDAFTIGDGELDTDRESTVRNSSVFQNTDSNYPNYLYEGADNLSLSGRYLRILMTANYPERAININEIIINGGAYIPVENNREFIGAVEEKGHQPSFMKDEDLTTTYKPSLQNSTMTYFYF